MNAISGWKRRLERASTSGADTAGIRFDAGRPIFLSAAPGRLDVMGGVADYSGSLVAEATIGECACVALQRTDRPYIRIASDGAGRAGFAPTVDIPLDELGPGPRSSEALRRRLAADPARRWAAYVAGCFPILLATKHLEMPVGGALILVHSDVPIGAGVSSSAALEVATMLAIDAAYGAAIAPGEIPVLAQQVENKIVGAPCGIMDQMSVAFGRRGALLLLLCRPHEILGSLELPAGAEVWGIDSAVKHSVAGSPYTVARIGAFMGRRIVRHIQAAAGHDPVEHLCEISPSRYRREFAAHVPKTIEGQEFLDWLGETGDAITRIDPRSRYAPRAATEHAIYENHRVERFVAHLRAAAAAKSATARAVPLVSAGEAMYASHWSYGRIGLGCRETNLLVRIARDMGPARGIFGAKITGGGSGGSVALLTCAADSAAGTVAEVAQQYAQATGLAPQIVKGGASDGALAMGTACAMISEDPISCRSNIHEQIA